MDKKYKNEILKVKELGEQIGYGNLMDIASVLWAQKLVDSGCKDIGAFYPIILSEIKKGKFKKLAIQERERKLKYYKSLGIE